MSLSFDDGPDRTWTPRVLTELARYEVIATFFMVGERVRAHPGLVDEVLAAGHEIQLHCNRHVRHTELTEEELRLDTEIALDTLAAAGVRPRLWRAPWGISTEATCRVAEDAGLQLVRWSVDTHDWRGDDSDHMLSAVCERLVDGSVVLMHDALGPGARRAGCENTVALVPALAAAARADGLTITPLKGSATTPPASAVGA